jgi:Multiubiquitin
MTEATETHDPDGSAHTEYAIVINGELAVVPHQTVSFTEVVAIAYPVPPSPQTVFTVCYEHAEGPRHEGLLVDGQAVKVQKDGTTFDVVIAGKS